MKALGRVVSEKNFFYVFLMTHPGWGPYRPKGAWLAGFIKRTTIHCYTQNMKAKGVFCGFGEEDFFYVFPMMPLCGAIWTPGARMAGFIKRTTIHCYLQNMKALGLVVSEKKFFFYVFPIVCLWEIMTPGRGIFDPRGMVGRIYNEDHYTLLHTKYESSGPCGFGEEDFYVSP